MSGKDSDVVEIDDMDDADIALLSQFIEDEEFCKRIDEDLDQSFAYSLQQQLDEIFIEGTSHFPESQIEKSLDSALSVIDEKWEILDPNPNIHSLFLQYNAEFFWGALASVEVRWSHRMTLCAGVCSYEGRGGLCSVRLSQPLLKFRPRRDLVETLLHEMIHAYLFVTANNKDHNAHGPEFLKHMHRINALTGAKISVYHSFHDEVDHYRKHWWKCTGPCQNRRPYFGVVKRAMNRAPSAQDPWWADHKATCGGTFVKFKQPEDYKQHKSNSQKTLPVTGNAKNDVKDIRTFFSPNSAVERKQAKDISTTYKTSGGPKFSNLWPHAPRNETTNTNVHTSSSPMDSKHKNFLPFSGKGVILGTSSGSVSPQYLNWNNKTGLKTESRGKVQMPSPEFSGNPFAGQNIQGTSSYTAGHSKNRDQPKSKVSNSIGGGNRIKTASAGSGSKTIVLHKSPKTVIKAVRVDDHTNSSKRNVYFTGPGHVLGTAETPKNDNMETPKRAPSQSHQQNSLDNFLGISPESSSRLKGKPFKRSTVIILSSDSEDDDSSTKKQLKKSDETECQTLAENSHDMQTTSGNNSTDSPNFVECPVCRQFVGSLEINSHLDVCLKTS